MTDEVAEAIADEATDVAEDVGAVAGAIAGAAAAEHAAGAAVEQAVERIDELAEHVEDAVDDQREDAQWERIRSTLLESENRVVTRVVEQLSPLLSRLSSAPMTIVEETGPTEEAAAIAEALDEAAEELAPDEGPAVEFDPGEAAPVEEQASGRRRVRGLGRRA